MIKLTKSQATLVFEALAHAIQDREGLARSYDAKDPAYRKYLKVANKYKKFREKLGDQLGWSTESVLDRLVSEAKSVSIVEFVRNKGKIE